MNELQGLNGMKKGELIEESKEDEYTLYVIDLWKNNLFNYSSSLFSWREEYNLI